MSNWETEYKKASLGRRIAGLRTLRDEDQATLAGKVSISQPTLCRIERDDLVPSVAVLSRLARMFGLTLDELVPASLGISEAERNNRSASAA